MRELGKQLLKLEARSQFCKLGALVASRFDLEIAEEWNTEGVSGDSFGSGIDRINNH